MIGYYAIVSDKAGNKFISLQKNIKIKSFPVPQITLDIGQSDASVLTGKLSAKAQITEGTYSTKYLSSYEKLPFDDKYFDVILCITAVHHFTNLNSSFKSNSNTATGSSKFHLSNTAGLISPK